MFRTSKHEVPAADRSRPRPSYLAPVRWRLLAVIAGAILVPSLLVEYVPPIRSFVGLAPHRAPTQPPLTSAEVANERVDTRLRSSSAEPSRPAAGPVVSGMKSDFDELRGGAGDEQVQILDIAVQDRWSRIREGLDKADYDRLRRVLKAARGGPPLTSEDQQAWEPILQRLNESWKEHSREATAALVDLTDAERDVWSSVLETMDAQWDQELLPALNLAATSQTLDESPQAAVVELQSVLDDLAWKAVRDNTIMRGAEGEAWFRCFELLQALDPKSLQSSAADRVGFVQLFKQPHEYRGKLVTVRGDVRLAYRVAAPANNSGISGYYVYWLKPAGGPNRPIVIYALETTPGFPALHEKSADHPGLELNEAAEFTGYFFKNWAYPAQDHTRLAPLLLARAPHWQPVLAPRKSLPSAGNVTVAVIASLAVAIALARYVYYKSPPPGKP